MSTDLCPKWCDPRTHAELDRYNHEHAAMPEAWKVAGDDVRVTIGVSQLEDVGDVPSMHPARVRLVLSNLYADDEAAADLTADDCRHIAETLLQRADQLQEMAR